MIRRWFSSNKPSVYIYIYIFNGSIQNCWIYVFMILLGVTARSRSLGACAPSNGSASLSLENNCCRCYYCHWIKHTNAYSLDDVVVFLFIISLLRIPLILFSEPTDESKVCSNMRHVWMYGRRLFSSPTKSSDVCVCVWARVFESGSMCARIIKWFPRKSFEPFCVVKWQRTLHRLGI